MVKLRGRRVILMTSIHPLSFVHLCREPGCLIPAQFPSLPSSLPPADDASPRTPNPVSSILYCTTAVK